MWAKARWSGMVAWKPTLLRPGIRPKRFFTAPVMPMNMWVFSLHRSMMPAQSRAGEMISIRLSTRPAGLATSRQEASKFSSTPAPSMPETA